MAIAVKDVLKLFIAEASFLAGSKRRQMGFDTTTKRALLHDDSTDTLAWAVSDDSLQCLLAGTQTLAGLKTFSSLVAINNELKLGTGSSGLLRSIDDLSFIMDDTGANESKFYWGISAATVLASTQLMTLDSEELAVSVFISALGGVKSSSTTVGVGYSSGAEAYVTQTTSRATGVTLNRMCGVITTDATSLAAGDAATFTVLAPTGGNFGKGYIPCVCIRSGATTNRTKVYITGVTDTTFDITVENNHASTAETGAIIINYGTLTVETEA